MKLIDWVLGRSLKSDEDEDTKIGVLAGVPYLGLDALGSAAYGPEAALTILIPLGLAGLKFALPITIVIVVLLSILYLSYRQTISAYPNGGGSYTVAKENLGERMALLAAASLMLDYILAVAVGISAGVGALVSAVPSLQQHTLALCLTILIAICLINLRGAKESGNAFALPTYLFIVSLGGVLIYGLFVCLTGHPHAVTPPPRLQDAANVPVGLGLVWVLLRAFASGCTAMTGVEAVSNGTPIFADPREKKAHGTLTVICVVLGLMLLAIVYLCQRYHIGATDPDSKSYQSVLSQVVSAIVGRGVLYYITIGSVLAVLALSANTGFAGFPRLCRMVAIDEYLPRFFIVRGRRLEFSGGILLLTFFAGGLLIVFGGITDRLIPLFAIGAFLAFTLSQFGMVAHWHKQDGNVAFAKAINFLGGLSTTVALLIIAVAKFMEGAWFTIILIPLLVVLFMRINKHYKMVRRQVKCERPLDIDDLQPPIVVIPIQSWTKISEAGLHFGMRISNEIYAVHVAQDEEKRCDLEMQWPDYVEKIAEAKKVAAPKLIILDSPYRRLFGPLYRYIIDLRDKNPGRPIAVIIPELQEHRWVPIHLAQPTSSVSQGSATV